MQEVQRHDPDLNREFHKELVFETSAIPDYAIVAQLLFYHLMTRTRPNTNVFEDTIVAKPPFHWNANAKMSF